MRFSPETDPHYWDHKVFTTNELYDAMEERDKLKVQLAEVQESNFLSRIGRDKMKSEIRKLKTKRKERKLSLRVIAARMEMSKSQLSRIEAYEHLSEKVIEKYRAALKERQ
jgi:hypothetical protein